MLGLAWAFLPDRAELRDGLILVGVARCIAMVFIWTDIAGGDAGYTAVLVACNSLLQIVLYAPIADLFLNHIGAGAGGAVRVDYGTVARSVGAFLGIPMGAALLTRFIFIVVLRQGRLFRTTVLPMLGPVSLIGLLAVIAIIFAAQGARVVGSIVDVVRVAAPLLVYFALTFAAALAACRAFDFSYAVAAAQAFTAASNNFELAIAVAVAGFGADSPQALAATVGPLVECVALSPLRVMLSDLQGACPARARPRPALVPALAQVGPAHRRREHRCAARRAAGQGCRHCTGRRNVNPTLERHELDLAARRPAQGSWLLAKTCLLPA